MTVLILRKCLVVVFLMITIASALKDHPYQYKEKKFEVPLDHFTYTTNITFNIRYLINDTYSIDETSPILFYVGNEGDIELFAQNTGFMWEAAPQLAATLIFAEHRYYGKSLPFGNQSYDSPQHLGYLTSEQALADYADLLTSINSKPKRPVIAIGGSYGGMLAAWFRMKYPHLVTGALAASAPILQFNTPCDVFNQIVTAVFENAYKPQCRSNIRHLWDVLDKLIATPEGRASLNNKFKFCKNLTKPEDSEEVFEYINDVLGNLAMVNYPYETSFLAPLPAYPVKEFCFRMSETYNDTELVTAFHAALQVYSNYTGKASCLSISSAYDPSMGDAGWNFQACTEMVMPMCATGEKDMFKPSKWNLQEYSNKCFKKFGVRPKELAAETTYGGKRLEGASNIIFSNGLIDPWCGGGVLRSTNRFVVIMIIPDGAHHLDLRAANPKDPNAVREARKMYLDVMKRWLQNE